MIYIFPRLFVCSIFYIYFGVYVLFINVKSLKNRVLFLFCIHLSLWALGNALMLIAPNIYVANLWRIVAAFGWCFISSIWLDVCILLKNERKEWMIDIKRLYMYVPGVFFFIVYLSYKPNEVIIRSNNMWKEKYTINPLQILYIIYYVVFFIIGMMKVYEYGKGSNLNRVKKQSKIIMQSSLATFIIAVFLDIILPIFKIYEYSYGVTAFAIGVIGVWYAITKYNMMSINSDNANKYILENIKDPVFLIGDDLLIKDVNSAALNITEFTKEEILNSNFKTFFLNSVQNEMVFEELIRLGSVKDIETNLPNKSNKYIPCLVSASSLYDDLQDFVGIAYVFHDITDRKNNERVLIKAQEELENTVHKRTVELKEINLLLMKEISERLKVQEELRKSEEKYMALIKQSLEGMLVFDPDTLKILESNRKVSDIFEISENEEKILTMDKLLPLDRKELLDKVKNIIEKRSVNVQETVTLKKENGSVKNIEYLMELVRYNSKSHIMVRITDVTEKLILEERKHQIVKLESLGTLAGGIAHDFNNILAGIIGYTQLALQDAEDLIPVKESLLEVLELGERAKGLIANILTFSRKTVITPKVIDIKDIIKDVINILKITIPPYIKIKEDFKCSDANVLVDVGEMRQLLMNLCINAGLAMKNNSAGILEIALADIIVNHENQNKYVKLENGKYIKIQVIDNGCGIERSIKERIFEPFFTTRGDEGGTGLGLSMAHSIVKRANGTITVDSELNKGSTFTVLLPLAQKSLRDEGVCEKVNNDITSARILFVDDEEDIVNANVRLLKHEGYNVTGAVGGKKALEILKAKKSYFDILITDKSMPDISGYSLIKELREEKFDISIILSSGFRNETDGEFINSMNTDEFLLKPILKNQYVNSIERIMKNRSKTIK